MSDPLVNGQNLSSMMDDAAAPEDGAVDGLTLRQVMRRVPSPVVVVTAAAQGEARGITIGSFTSVSLDPPLVCFNVTQSAQMHDHLLAAERFAVHVLGEGQAPLAEHFALPGLTGAEQLAPVPHTRRPDGTPVLDGVSAVLHCAPHARFEAGDHTILVGRVTAVDMPPDEGAVLYYQRAYRRVGDELRLDDDA
jgi:flavin reductase (DIM6/NTAB) family NADH-FMN oxidoreductase RutF